MRYSKWVAKLGGFGYDLLILLNRAVNTLLQTVGQPRISLSKRIKESVKSAIRFIDDFEPVSAWACRIRSVSCVGMSHQVSFLSSNTPRPQRKSLFAEQIFRHYAPCTHPIGFHYESYDHFIYPPVIRHPVHMLEPYQRDVVSALPAAMRKQVPA